MTPGVILRSPRADLNGAPTGGGEGRAGTETRPYVIAFRGGLRGTHPTGPPYVIAKSPSVLGEGCMSPSPLWGEGREGGCSGPLSRPGRGLG